MLAVINSCYKEVELPPVPEVVFELSVSPEMQEFISVSRDTSYTIDEPGMEFFLGKEQLKLKVIKTLNELQESSFEPKPSKVSCQYCDFKDICQYRMG
jgi:hypothetical protein